LQFHRMARKAETAVHFAEMSSLAACMDVRFLSRHIQKHLRTVTVFF